MASKIFFIKIGCLFYTVQVYSVHCTYRKRGNTAQGRSPQNLYYHKRKCGPPLRYRADSVSSLVTCKLGTVHEQLHNACSESFNERESRSSNNENLENVKK